MTSVDPLAQKISLKSDLILIVFFKKILKEFNFDYPGFYGRGEVR